MHLEEIKLSFRVSLKPQRVPETSLSYRVYFFLLPKQLAVALCNRQDYSVEYCLCFVFFRY